jgi:hypothetical protein
MSDIFYKPNLEYEKNYKTEGTTPYSGQDTVQDSQTTTNSAADRIVNLVSLLPDDLAKNILPSVVYVTNIVHLIGDVEDDPKDTITMNPIDVPQVIDDTAKDVLPDATVTTSIDDYPLPVSVFPNSKVFDMSVVIGADKPTKINIQYKKDISNVLNDFIAKLDTKISDYFSKIVSTLAESSSNNLINSIGVPYSIKTSEIKDANLKHMSDMLVRTQVIRDQKTRMTKKMFNLNGTTTHIKSCKTTAELRNRYSIEKEAITESILDIIQNSSLSALKAGYDKKYKENFYSLYKYLNGAVIMIDECLRLYVQEAQAKAILSKKEGIKL